MAKITILGCGRWASFHAWYQSQKLHNDVLIWGRSDDPIYQQLSTTKKNRYLDLPDSVVYSSDLVTALDYAEIIIVAIAAQAMQEFSVSIKNCHPQHKTFVLCMKGIDQTTGERLSEIISKNIDKTNDVCVWVGPGHPEELTDGKPNVMVLAGTRPAVVKNIAKTFSSSLITLLQNDDCLGVEIGAAAKNVMGLAAGFLDGLGCTSLKGALMVRGCDEVARLISKMGGKRLTAFGMSHLGDFEATLFSQNSHNRRYGEEFIKGDVSPDIGTAEGLGTAKALHDLATKYKVAMPITETVYQTLYEKLSPEQVVASMFKMEATEEFIDE